VDVKKLMGMKGEGCGARGTLSPNHAPDQPDMPASRRLTHPSTHAIPNSTLPPPNPAPAEDDPDAEPSRLQKLLLGPGSHLVLAIVCSKAMIPLKLPVAVALTPYVHRRGRMGGRVERGREGEGGREEKQAAVFGVR
jgi:hypothetical protein